MFAKFPKSGDEIVKSSKRFTTATFNSVDATIVRAAQGTDTYIAPIRTSVLKRFPIIFSLLTTFGVATTFLGFEKIVSNITFLDQHPFVMLILGISILATTGTLYKKLS